ncbi:DNA internalization-related competence protein ComEC/Rec2 [Lysobacter psychrotolerans]|uniref:DNA internalization-related competence protein ComEC/Rec2 n=1 Tax=Montanilutibacter psychrotolerans TaxID=1327343 RepID=A0A3M8SVD6_9GAMM|nr:DNA internalization-related competence protein ComEC/Rec2 [Lysobacter psychrotolerans]RNF83194.1 DNA internalization-related competence protein ComEC/Rec2 [Lysobacter psychrotolerans]
MDDAARTPPFGTAAAAALLIGTTAALGLPWLSPWWLALAVLGIGVAGWWHGRAGRWYGPLLTGFALASLHAAHALSLQLPADLTRLETRIAGRIVELPVHEPRRTRLDVRVDNDVSQPAALRGRLLRLAWYSDNPEARRELLAGQRWQFDVRLRAPRGLRNPGGMDAEMHAMARRVTANGYIREPSLARLLASPTGLQAWRERMSTRIAGSVSNPAARFVQALSVGDTRGLDDGDWAVLRANGLTHLVAISGFHVGLVAGLFSLLARVLWWLLPGLARRWPRQIAAALAAVAGASLYTAVAGFALPTVRTLLMIAILALVRVARRPLGGFDTLALAAIAMLLVDPLAVLAAGFWLSFLGVAWLLWCLPPSSEPASRGAMIGDLVSAQGVASLGLLPLGVVLFGQASLAGPIANLIAVPWWSLVVVPLALVGTGLEGLHAGWGQWCWQAAAWCFQQSWPLFDWLAGSGLALWWLPEAAWYALPLALLGAFWLLLPRGVPGKALALLLWLPLLWPQRHLPATGEAELAMLDVGQGLSVLVRTRHHTLLYDMGPAVRDGFDAGERAVVPALHALGVRRLDAAVVSHGDNDHAGGYPAVAAVFPADAGYAPADSPVAGKALCEAGRRWTWDEVEFAFLHPPPHFPYLGNESSCVLRIRARHGSALLTGDIGQVVERDLVRLHGDELRSDVVLAAHHGSGGSSDPGFVQATRPQRVLVSSGHGNRFGHPKPDVLARWAKVGAQSVDTARDGAVRVRLLATGVEVETRRAARPRFWDAARRSATAPAGLSYRPE